MRDAVDVTEKILRVIVRGNGYVSPHSLLDLIRARDAEVRADERAKVLAGFEVEEFDVHHALADDGTCSHVMRRLVSPWEPTP